MTCRVSSKTGFRKLRPFWRVAGRRSCRKPIYGSNKEKSTESKQTSPGPRSFREEADPVFDRVCNVGWLASLRAGTRRRLARNSPKRCAPASRVEDFKGRYWHPECEGLSYR